MWGGDNKQSNSGYYQCKICKSSYPECSTCQKYGRVSHQDDKEKQKNCHDNSGFVHDENYKQSNK
jgi:hypothetical protein